MKENTIYFKPTKRVKFARSYNHAVVGVLLVILGIESLSHRETGHLVFAFSQIAIKLERYCSGAIGELRH